MAKKKTKSSSSKASKAAPSRGGLAGKGNGAKSGQPSAKTPPKKGPASRSAKKSEAAVKKKMSATTEDDTLSSRKEASPLAGKAGNKTVRGFAESLFLDHATDDLLALQLLEELEIGPGLDVATIDLRVRDGHAILRGTVSDVEELEAARDALMDTGSVVDLTSLLQIAPERRDEDRDRARRVQELLEREPDMADESIQVACVGTRLIVRGTVGTPLRKAKVGLYAMRISDASRVVNRLVLVNRK